MVNNRMSWHTGMRLIGLSLLMGACALAVPRIPEVRGLLSANGLQFLRGLCFGLAVAFFVTGAAAIATAKVRDKNGPRRN